MNPQEYDGISLLILSEPFNEKTLTVLFEGIGSFDGEIFKIINDKNKSFIIPEDKWTMTVIPLTGIWKQKYPNSDFYLVL